MYTDIIVSLIINVASQVIAYYICQVCGIDSND